MGFGSGFRGRVRLNLALTLTRCNLRQKFEWVLQEESLPSHSYPIPNPDRNPLLNLILALTLTLTRSLSSRSCTPRPISPLYLPYISPISPLYLPYISLQEPHFSLVHAAAFNGHEAVLRYLRTLYPPSFMRAVDATGTLGLGLGLGTPHPKLDTSCPWVDSRPCTPPPPAHTLTSPHTPSPPPVTRSSPTSPATSPLTSPPPSPPSGSNALHVSLPSSRTRTLTQA